MQSATTSPSASSDSLFSAFLPLLPLMLAVFLAFFVSGMAFPVVPRHVHDTLGFGTFLVGVAMGAQYFSSILVGRMLSGHVTDERGPKLATSLGTIGIACVGLFYLASHAVAGQPALSLGILIAGRMLTGIAEAFIITSTLSWGIARTAPEHTGKVIGWIGMALFAAYGVGAAAGAAIYGRFGFVGVAMVTVVVPLLALAVTLRIASVPPTHMQRPAFYKVVGLVKLPGLALTLSSFGYAAVNAFIALLWLQRGWGSAAVAFMAMAIGFLASRLTLGHLPDKVGGAKIAGICVAFEAVGQLLIWWTSSEWVACIGAALTGAGYSLAFQGFGVEAVNRAPPQSRGAAMGGYVAFQDLSMALAGPFGGWLALQAGLDAVYLAGSLTAIASVGLAWWMVKTGARSSSA